MQLTVTKIPSKNLYVLAKLNTVHSVSILLHGLYVYYRCPKIDSPTWVTTFHNNSGLALPNKLIFGVVNLEGLP